MKYEGGVPRGVSKPWFTVFGLVLRIRPPRQPSGHPRAETPGDYGQRWDEHGQSSTKQNGQSVQQLGHFPRKKRAVHTEQRAVAIKQRAFGCKENGQYFEIGHSSIKTDGRVNKQAVVFEQRAVGCKENGQSSPQNIYLLAKTSKTQAVSKWAAP